MITRALGFKSHANMMHGLSARELMMWKALHAVEQQEQKDAHESATGEKVIG